MYQVINQQGYGEILDFLRKNHRFCQDNDFFDKKMLDAWATDAEFQLAEGNPPTIEIPAHYAVCGRAIELRISDEGVDQEQEGGD